MPAPAWQVALDADGDVREHADVAELTGLLDPTLLAGWPPGMRVIVRREHPHPGAPLTLFEHRDGWRYQAFVTNTESGQLAFLEARHRAHARVEDRIRHAKDTGLGRLPVPRVRDQPSLARLRHPRRGPHRMAAPARPARQPQDVRAEGAALPAAAHPRQAHSRRPPTTPANPGILAVGRRRPHTFTRVMAIPAPG